MQIEAVIFDWGGTLTRWHEIDFHAESLALAHAVVESDRDVDVHVDALHRANQVIWGRSRDHQQSATVADLFTEAGLEHDPDAARPLPGVLGAAHHHRPAGRAAVHDLARARHPGRRPLQHDLATRSGTRTSSAATACCT